MVSAGGTKQERVVKVEGFRPVWKRSHGQAERLEDGSVNVHGPGITDVGKVGARCAERIGGPDHPGHGLSGAGAVLADAGGGKRAGVEPLVQRCLAAQAGVDAGRIAVGFGYGTARLQVVLVLNCQPPIMPRRTGSSWPVSGIHNRRSSTTR